MNLETLMEAALNLPKDHRKLLSIFLDKSASFPDKQEADLPALPPSKLLMEGLTDPSKEKVNPLKKGSWPRFIVDHFFGVASFTVKDVLNKAKKCGHTVKLWKGHPTILGTACSNLVKQGYAKKLGRGVFKVIRPNEKR